MQLNICFVQVLSSLNLCKESGKRKVSMTHGVIMDTFWEIWQVETHRNMKFCFKATSVMVMVKGRMLLFHFLPLPTAHNIIDNKDLRRYDKK